MPHDFKSSPILPLPVGALPLVSAPRPKAVRIETARLTLTAPRPQDATAMARLANDPAVATMTARLPYPYRDTDAVAFIASCTESFAAGQGLALAIRRSEDSAFLGMIGLTLDGDGTAEIGYWIGQPHWGKGYATEAARALIDHGFLGMTLVRITGSTRVINEASRRVLEKCGLHYTSSGLTQAPPRGGALPVDRFELTRRDWEGLRSWTSPHVHEDAAALLGEDAGEPLQL